MKNYFRIMLGQESKYAKDCYNGNFIGIDYQIKQDLTGKLPDNWREFNEKYIPIYLSNHPGKSKVAAGLACGFIWTISKGVQNGDIILSPDGWGKYYVREVVDNYSYHAEEILPHRRIMKWYTKMIDRTEMSEALKGSTGTGNTVTNITRHAQEIENLISNIRPPIISVADESVEDPTVFALEKHLEDFLVQNWKQTEFGKNYDIYTEENELVGQQYPTDTGDIDILAISKDKKELLVVELKKGRASDAVVGQIQRYMGFVIEELAEENQIVKGAIVAFEDDIKIKRELAVTKNIEFYKYQVSFKLIKS